MIPWPSGFREAVNGKGAFLAVLLCLTALSLLFATDPMIGGPGYELSEGNIVAPETGKVVDSLYGVEFVCLIGDPMTVANGKVDGRALEGCPVINGQGIVVGRPQGCAFYEIVSHRVLDEYDAQCRDDAGELKQFDRYGIPTLYFDERG